MSIPQAASIRISSCDGCDGVHIILLDEDDNEIAEGILSVGQAVQFAEHIRSSAKEIAREAVVTPPSLANPKGNA